MQGAGGGARRGQDCGGGSLAHAARGAARRRQEPSSRLRIEPAFPAVGGHGSVKGGGGDVTARNGCVVVFFSTGGEAALASRSYYMSRTEGRKEQKSERQRYASRRLAPDGTRRGKGPSRRSSIGRRARQSSRSPSFSSDASLAKKTACVKAPLTANSSLAPGWSACFRRAGKKLPGGAPDWTAVCYKRRVQPTVFRRKGRGTERWPRITWWMFLSRGGSSA